MIGSCRLAASAHRALAATGAATVALLVCAGVSSVQAQALPVITAVLAAPHAAPDCLPTSDMTYVAVAAGPTGVLLSGRGFQPGQRAGFGWLSSTRTPPTTKIVYHDVLPIAGVLADGSGRFACEVYLDLRFDSRPLYYQIGAFFDFPRPLAGTEDLPVAVLLFPALPSAGSGGNKSATAFETAQAALAAATAFVTLGVAGFWLATRTERRSLACSGDPRRQR